MMRPPMPNETPLSPAEIEYLTNDTLPTALCQHNYRNRETGQNLCELVDTPILGARPVPTLKPQRFGNDRARAQESAKYLMGAV